MVGATLGQVGTLREGGEAGDESLGACSLAWCDGRHWVLEWRLQKGSRRGRQCVKRCGARNSVRHTHRDFACPCRAGAALNHSRGAYSQCFYGELPPSLEYLPRRGNVDPTVLYGCCCPRASCSQIEVHAAFNHHPSLFLLNPRATWTPWCCSAPRRPSRRRWSAA